DPAEPGPGGGGGVVVERIVVTSHGGEALDVVGGDGTGAGGLVADVHDALPHGIGTVSIISISSFIMALSSSSRPGISASVHRIPAMRSTTSNSGMDSWSRVRWYSSKAAASGSPAAVQRTAPAKHSAAAEDAASPRAA